MKPILPVAALLGCLCGVNSFEAYAEGFAAGRYARSNAAGGVSAGEGRAVRGANGGGFRQRAMATDGSGNAIGASRGAVRTQSGAAARTGVTTHSAEGTTQHESVAGGSGERGRFGSSGSSTYNRDTGLDASRSTSATSSSGATYSGDTSYTKDAGVSHSSSCKDASGADVACR